MNNYLEEVDKITIILKREKKSIALKQVENAKLMGGTGGEIFDIICSLLTTYKIADPSLFELVKDPAEELLQYAKDLGREPAANFQLLEELSN